MKLISCFLIVVVIQAHLLVALYVPQAYKVPMPRFKVFSPAGLRVSIPDVEGIDLFAFHGNINEPIKTLQSEQYYKNVLKKTDHEWVFEDENIKLKEGDVIYYWILVIKDKFGYRSDNGRFVVTDIVQKQPDNHSHASSSRPTTQSNSDDKTRTLEWCSPMREMVLNLSNTMDQLKGDVKMCTETNDILKDIIARDDESSRTLRFEGILPAYDDAHYAAQIILKEKLGVHIPLMNATRDIDKSIRFQVASLDDKIYLIKLAREKLEKMNSKIILTY